MLLDPRLLPDLPDLRRRTQALALLDALISPDWDSRYYSYNAAWGTDKEMASMRNGQGDEWFLLLDHAGAAFKGLDHESVPARGPDFPAAIQAQVPAIFESFLREPAFSMDYASFCYWRGAADAAWQRVRHPDPALAAADDGSDWMLALLVAPPSAYQEFVRDYFEQEADLRIIERVFMHTPLTMEMVAVLNPDLALEEAAAMADEIGYVRAFGPR